LNEFNAAGLLVPSKIINATLHEFERYFSVDSPEDIRRTLFNQYLSYKDELKELCEKTELKQWIDGSFVTKKPKPADIDLVTFVDFETAKLKEKELKEFIYPASLANYGLDGYIIVIYPEDHKLYFIYQADCAYWTNQFDKTKPDKRYKSISKGFLEIII